MNYRSEQQKVLQFYYEPYTVSRWDEYDYHILRQCPVDQARGKEKRRLAEAFMMLDTETSKSRPDIVHRQGGKKVYEPNPNYVVKWSLAINIYGFNIAVIWGDDPEQCMEALIRIRQAVPSTHINIYVHNLAFDWMFLRKFFFRRFGHPKGQLNTKKHYPINLEFESGIVLRDSLILCQRSLERWGDDLQVPHAKAVGKWDYDKIRHQRDGLSDDELLYICNDVLCGVECLNVFRKTLRKTYTGMPYTQTGVIRQECGVIGKEHKAHQKAVGYYSDLYTYMIEQFAYHGGYTHNNRLWKGIVIDDEPIYAFDFASRYPATMLSEKMPAGRFVPARHEYTVDEVLAMQEDYAFIFTFKARSIRLKDHFFPMPLIQVSKCLAAAEGVYDNGRMLEAEYVEIVITEVDLALIREYYEWDAARICGCVWTVKDYLPRWLTDYIYELFRQKTLLKGGDPILYAIAKAKLNSVYGMCVQKLLPDDILEDFDTGEYYIERKSTEEDFQKVLGKNRLILNYAWGIWTTCYAMRDIFELGKIFSGSGGEWLYTDTDSVYGLRPDMAAIDKYNRKVREKMQERGYPGIEFNGREYWLGVAELDGEYTEFVGLHSKCYCTRDKAGKLKITVAGVPKKSGVKCLKDDIRNFRDGFIFDGETTGKLTHSFQYTDEIYSNERGDIIGDSINLYPCDYQIDTSIEGKINKMMDEEVNIIVFDDEYTD